MESVLVVSGTGRLGLLAETLRSLGHRVEIGSIAEPGASAPTVIVLDAADADAAESASAARVAFPEASLLASVPPGAIGAVPELLDAGVEDVLCEPHPPATWSVRLLLARRSRAAARAQLEQAVLRSNERFALVARAVSDAIWDLRVPSGEIAWAFGVSQFGYTPEAAGDLDWWKSNVHPDDQRRVVASLDHALASEDEDDWQEEYLFRRADGSWVPVFDRGRAVRDASGRVVRMVGAMSDVSERRELEGRLQLADRMAAVGTLAAGIAHEVNNPLAYVLGNLELARDAIEAGTFDAAVLIRALDDAAGGAGRIAEIVRDMRAFSRPEDARVGPVDLVPALQSAVGMAENELRHRARLITRYESVPLVRANASRLGHLFLNLLLNAAQAIPEGEPGHEVTITVRRGPADDVLIEVADTGRGIEPEHLKHVFVPFFTTRQGHGGTGLGLSICHGIVTSLGGEIRIESAVGAGTTVQVRLAVAAPAALPATPREAITGAHRRVLVVDDEPGILEVISHMLREHEVVCTLRAQEALEWLEAGATYDVILCDLMMPEMTGMDFHANVQRRWPEVAERFVFLTGGAFTPRARSFLEAVPNRRIEKPFRAAAIRDAVGGG